MTDIVGYVFWMLVTLGVLVTFHEFGHFWVARRCGVRVLRFSVGFGKPLWRRTGRDGTEYVVAALPLGGYVKMLDSGEGEVPAHARHQAFDGKPVGQRIAIVAAGPLANLLLCLAAMWLVFVIGRPDFLPEIGRSEGLAAEAGLAAGDRLLEIRGEAVETWTGAGIALATAAMDREPAPVRVRRADGSEAVLTLPLDRPQAVLREERVLQDLGLRPAQWSPDTLVGTVLGAAAAAGLQPGDVVLAVGDRPVERWEQIGTAVQELARPGEALVLRVRRGDGELDLAVDPRPAEREDGSRYWQLGIGQGWQEPAPDALLRYGPLAAVPAAFAETWSVTRNTLGVLRRMLTGHASLRNLSGPVTIAKVASHSAERGVPDFLYFLAILSLSLCIMNLLPIPVLDGGHLLYYLIELVKGSPVGESVRVAGQFVGLALLAGLIGLAFYNDLFRPSF
ncbi:RIP metalloprotease RseP [Arenimonas composti]|uniref:Zinc metalloprotease n=1 Tax=Arenimonas composti TR7-09 = DSM 18010 TaxID=1121013 RepID=A0A091BFP6_9GAMM|nr:RIP metalloprotease RseP [Arenimonas composti]KFN49629.1 hypothetical protein P873_09690 [Arenimonas composti TR7-09 = DSM 18010]